MASCDGPLSIDVSQYVRLPPDVRVRFDCWLTAEKLTDKAIVKLRLSEGTVTVERYALDDSGRPLGEGDEYVMTTETFPVESLPPKEAFDRNTV